MHDATRPDTPPSDAVPTDAPRRDVTQPDASTAVDDLLEAVLAAPAGARADALARACTEHPEHADVLRRRYLALARTGMLADEDDPTPRKFGEFTLLERIGSGGMGVVWRAHQHTLGRDVALKLVRPELAWFDQTRARLRREAETIARLDHPNILPIHAVGEAHGVAFLVMPLLRGCSLADVVALLAAEAKADVHTRPPWCVGSWTRAAVEVVLLVAQALVHAHARGIVHRDIKPSNVMLTHDGRVLLLDFGLAATAQGRSLTRTGTVMGSFGYASPEQLQGAKVDARTDVFALGVVLYELLTLRAPFAGDSTHETVQRVLSVEPPPLDRYNRAAGRDLAAIVQRAIEKDARARYATMAAFAADLRAWRDGGALSVRADTTLRRVRRYVRRQPLRAAAAALAGLAVLIAAGWTGHWLAIRDVVALGRDAQRADAVRRQVVSGLEHLFWGTRAAAREAFAAALALDPGCEAAATGLAIVEERAGEPAVPEEPASAAALFHRAFWLLTRGPYGSRAAAEEANALLVRAVQRAPAAEPWYHYTWLQAAGWSRNGAVVEAAAASATQLWPDAARTHFFVGTAWLEIDPARARASLERALQLDPELVLARAQLGVLRLHDGDPQGAAEDLAVAVAHDPRNGRAWIDLGIARERCGDLPGAIAALRAAVDAESTLPGAWFNLARLLAAVAEGEHDAERREVLRAEAAAGYRAALRVEPRYAPALRNLGLLASEAGDHGAAVDLLRRLVALDPESADAYRCLAFACMAAGDCEGALSAYRDLVRLAPDDAEAHSFLCLLLERSGDADALRVEHERWQGRSECGPREQRR